MIFSSDKYYWVASRYANIHSDQNAMFGIISIGNNIFLNGGGLCYVSGYYQGIYGRYLRSIITIKSNMLNNECEKDENGVWHYTLIGY